jgi:thiamine-monophosphate kinase
MDLSTVGERETIAAIVDIIREGQEGLRGDLLNWEDDCAAIETPQGWLLVTMDVVNSGTHFPFGTPMDMAGWYAAAVNISDLAAMGAQPLGLLLALGLPATMTPQETSELVEGAVRCATRFRVPILGGDTKKNDVLTVAGTALGMASAGAAMTRRAARPLAEGDAVAVTGTLGAAAAGCIMARSIAASGNPIRDRKRYLGALKKVLLVTPRLAEGRAMAGTGLVKCAMDLSDGLARSLHTLGELNDCGFTISLDRVPADGYALQNAMGTGKSPEELCLYYGGDFELLCVIDGNGRDVDELKRVASSAGAGLTVIGKVGPAGEFLLETEQGVKELEDRGWEHFFSS